ncbi:unnamed protein product [Lampetra fluviatilis]
MEEALKVLPTALDDRTLAAFISIPPANRAMLQDAIFEPPSETPLAYRSSLLVLARVAYPFMDGSALESLALERVLCLAWELGVALAIAEEADISSLRVAQGIQAHLAVRPRS